MHYFSSLVFLHLEVTRDPRLQGERNQGTAACRLLRDCYFTYFVSLVGEEKSVGISFFSVAHFLNSDS